MVKLYYPPLGFHYKVVFEFKKDVQDSDKKNVQDSDKKVVYDNDVHFQSVSGLTVEYDYENFKEGGENRFEHKLPVRTKYADMVLKRGMLTDSKVIKWFLDAFRDRKFKPTNLNISLKNEKHEIVRTWKVAHAVPKKWLVSDFNASESSIVIETMELTYRYFTVSPFEANDNKATKK